MNAVDPRPRRSNHTEMPVAYAAIGASGAPDLMRFPPDGSTPYEEALQLGSGAERFLTAANLLMTWGAQRAAGVDVVDVELGEPFDYTGIHFAEDGQPEVKDEPEELFSPEGEPYVQPGTRATFKLGDAKDRRIMVISTIVEQRRLGFTWGDRDESPGLGEQLLFVEHRDDGTVWAIARGFAFPQSSGLMSGIKQRAELREVLERAQAFLAALAPGAALRTGVAKPAKAEEGDADAEATADNDAAGDTNTESEAH